MTKPTPATIIAAVCRVTGVCLGELVGGYRYPERVRARRLTVYLCRELTNASFPEIATAMWRRSWSNTVAQDQIARRLVETDAEFTRLVQACMVEIENRRTA